MADPDYRALAVQEAQRAGVDPALVLRVLQTESAGQPGAVSPKGAIGLMQLMPQTAKELGVDPNVPEQNIRGGVRYLKQQLDRYQGDVSKALAAYNAGPGAVDQYGGVPPFKETKDYVAHIGGGMPTTLDAELADMATLDEDLAHLASARSTPPPSVASAGMLQPSTRTGDPSFLERQVGRLPLALEQVPVSGEGLGPFPTSGAIAAAKAAPGLVGRFAGRVAESPVTGAAIGAHQGYSRGGVMGALEGAALGAAGFGAAGRLRRLIGPLSRLGTAVPAAEEAAAAAAPAVPAATAATEGTATERLYRALARKPILTPEEAAQFERLQQMAKQRASHVGMSFASGGKTGIP